jgi:sugar lactone lactonase YvrE
VDSPTGVTVDAPFHHRHELAEMPHWDAARQRLCYVDINHGTINELDVTTGERTVITLTAPLGFAMPVAGSGLRVCGEGTDLVASTPRAPSWAGSRSNRVATTIA